MERIELFEVYECRNNRRISCVMDDASDEVISALCKISAEKSICFLPAGVT